MDIFSNDVEQKPQVNEDGLNREDVMICLFQLSYLPFLKFKDQYS